MARKLSFPLLVTDYTDTIMAKIFVPNEFLAELKKDVAVGKAVTVKASP